MFDNQTPNTDWSAKTANHTQFLITSLKNCDVLVLTLPQTTLKLMYGKWLVCPYIL